MNKQFLSAFKAFRLLFEGIGKRLLLISNGYIGAIFFCASFFACIAFPQNINTSSDKNLGDSTPAHTVYTKTQFDEYIRTNNNTVGYAGLGFYGEIIILPKNYEQYIRFWIIVKAQDGLDLIFAESLPEVKIYASIDSNGQITYFNNINKDIQCDNRPEVWPYMKDSGVIQVPHGIAAIMNEETKNNNKLQDDALGWFYRLDNELLISAGKGLAPVKDSIVAFRTSDGGLELRYFGPHQTGVYARIANDCKMTYFPIENITSMDSNEIYYWSYRNENKLPAFGYGISQSYKCKQPPRGWCWTSGEMGVDGTPIN